MTQPAETTGWFSRRRRMGPFAAIGLLLAAFPAVWGAGVQAAPASWDDAVVYFAMIDRWADGDSTNNINVDVGAKGAFHGGDLAGLRRNLSEISDLGVSAIWITPVVKNIDGFVTGAGFPDWAYHGYWTDDFTRIDPRFGSEDELRELVAACHAKGIRVLLDVVYNHAGYNSRYVTDPATKNWLRSNEAGTCGQDDLTSCVSGLPDFRTELPEVDRFLLDAQLDWARRSGVDGFRLDTVKHIDHAFWQEHRRRLREEVNPAFFLVGEVWGGDAKVLDPWFAGDEMDAGFDFGFEGSTVGFLLGRGRTVAFDRYLKSREKVRHGYLLAHFLSSHDVEGAWSLLQGDRELFRLAVLLQFTCAGIPVVCWGDEVGRPGGAWPDNRSDMPWGDRGIKPGAGRPRDEALRDDYRKLIAIRRGHPALSRGVHAGLSSAGDLLVFSRTDSLSGDAVVVAVNRGPEPATATFATPRGFTGAPIADLWSGGSFPLPADSMQTTVAARSARILTPAPRPWLNRKGDGSMAEVVLTQVAKRYGPVSVIEKLDLTIRDQEFMVLVGPSGCGKSTLLRMIAGLEEISEGTIRIGDRVVNDMAPKDRDIAMVFQNYALYPHMSVRQNLEFGLRIRKMPSADIDKLVTEAAEMLGITPLLDRKPKQLSGGQRQRVAVGRAIVRKPSVFLFDEPLSNLDAKLRVQMRAEISKLQQRLQTTCIYVTHDQVEAMTMGDRIAVMKEGAIHQLGTPLEVYESPVNVFVAQFIGTPPMNFFPAVIRDSGAVLEATGYTLPVAASLRPQTAGRDGTRVLVGVRPDNIRDASHGGRGETAPVTAEVEVVEPLGHEVIVHGRVGVDLLVAALDTHRAPRIGSKLDLLLELDSFHLFDAATELRLTAGS